MNGIQGTVRRDGTPFDPAEIPALAECRTGPADVIARSDASALAAGGWARLHQAGDVCVVGAAHLVNRADLDSAGRYADPLEAAAQLYRQCGVDAFERLHGQFCLALYDRTARRLVLATDRFATRPIYYLERSGTLAFGTDLYRVMAEQPCSIDAQAILEYLLYTVIPAPRTPFVGVRKLPAGHLLTFDRGGMRVDAYWDMTYPEGPSGRIRSWAPALRAEIEAAVARCVAAEESRVAIGTFLSGGTDSSTVSGMIGKITGRPAHTFSIGYREAAYDESSYARTAARWFGTVHHEWRLSPREAFDALPAVVGYYAEPFGNASALPTYRCAQLAREHGVTVLLAGDGGNELFAGSARYCADKVFALYQTIPRPLRRLLEPCLAALPAGLPILDRARRYVRRANLPNPRRFFSYNAMLSEPLSDLLSPDFCAAVAVDDLLAVAEADFHRPAAGTSELNRLLYVDLKLVIGANDVRKVSGMTELAGVEVRYPLLDTRLVEFSGRIPSRLKLHGLQQRYLFKQALANFLPPEVLTKPNHGFGAPIAVWMRNDPQWNAFIGDLLHDARTRQRGYVKPAMLDRYWNTLRQEGTSFYGDSLWTWVMLELWFRRHEANGGRAL